MFTSQVRYVHFSCLKLGSVLNRLLIHGMRAQHLLRDVSKLFSHLDAKLSAIHFHRKVWTGKSEEWCCVLRTILN